MIRRIYNCDFNSTRICFRKSKLNFLSKFMIQDNAKYIQPYIDLVESFINGQISARQFEKSFLEKFKNNSSQFDETEYKILNNVFYDVEDFCADPTIRGEGDLDEQQLKTKSKKHLEELRSLDISISVL
jgi:hypothetical protein